MKEKTAKTPRDPAQMKHLALKRTVGIISVVIFIALLVWITFAIGIPLINQYFGSTDASKANTDFFDQLLAENPIGGRLIFLGIQILQVFVAFIPGEVVELMAGVIFGPVEGTILSILGVTIGSTIIFLLTKALGLRFVTLFVSEEKLNSFAIIKNDTRLNTLVFIIFLIPGTPKDLLTYFVGLTRMKLLPFLGISLIARIPSVLTSTLAGNYLIEKNYIAAIIVFVITGVLAAVGLVLYNVILKKRKAKAEALPAQSESESDSAQV